MSQDSNKNQAKLQWAAFAAAVLMTLLSVLQLRNLSLDTDLYGLLDDSDPEVRLFRDIERQTPELNGLIVVCEADVYPARETLDELRQTVGVTGEPITFLRPGKSSAYVYALQGNAASYGDVRPTIESFNRILGEAALDCGLTGTPAVIFETQEIVNEDLLLALGVAAVLVLVIFSFVYRIGLLALALLLPVLTGIVWGLAAYSLVRPELTLLAATVPTLLIGIGIDHCIHLIQGTRYGMTVEGLSKSDAVVTTWQRLLRPITVATLTTCSAFLAMLVADLQGLVDLGWGGAMVTMGVYLSCVVLMPLVLLVAPRRWLAHDVPLQRSVASLAPFVIRHRRRIAIVVTVVTIAAIGLGLKLELLSDNRSLEVGDLPSRDYQSRFAEEHGLTPTPLLLMFDDPEAYIELLAEPERPAEIATIMDVRQVPGLLQIHATGNAFDRDVYGELNSALDSWVEGLGLGGFKLTGGPAMNARLDAVVRHDIATVVPLALVLILLALAVFSRSLVQPIILLAPLAIALAWLGGSMTISGVPLSMMTVAIVPLVLGIGVDSSVHLTASWRRRNGDLSVVFAETGLAIVVTTLTSVAAFSAFTLAASPALVQFGWEASLALIYCLVGTLLVLPSILSPASTGAMS